MIFKNIDNNVGSQIASKGAEVAEPIGLLLASDFLIGGSIIVRITAPTVLPVTNTLASHFMTARISHTDHIAVLRGVGL